MEHGVPRGPLRVIVEPGLENVLQILRVARDSHEALLFGEEWNCAGAGLVRAATLAEIVADPVV